MEQVVASEGHIAFEARLQLQRVAADALDTRGIFHIAVPGGSVAQLVFPSFADAALDWSRVHVWWVDERVVPLTDKDSNFKIANELWVSKAPLQAHPFVDADAYERDLPHPLDVALLGVGPDGHIASLFPGHPGLDEKGRRAFAIHDSPKPPPERLTLSLGQICSAREVWIVCTGMTKAQMLMKAMRPDSQLPLARVIRESVDVRLWLDPAAATYL